MRKGRWQVPVEIPAIEQIEREKKRLRHKRRYRRTLKSTLAVLVVVSALAVLAATLWMPVLRIYGASMTPTLKNGEIIFTVKTSDFEEGDIIAFYYNNKILVKRVIAKAGDWVDMDEDGTVYVNSVKIDEPYLTEKAYGDTNIEMPYQVPDGKVFVMGDRRSTSVDSRNKLIGCVSQEQVVGKIIFRIWSLNRLGTL